MMSLESGTSESEEQFKESLEGIFAGIVTDAWRGASVAMNQ